MDKLRREYIYQNWHCLECKRKWIRVRRAWDHSDVHTGKLTDQPWILGCEHRDKLMFESKRIDCPDGRLFVFDHEELE